MTTAGEGSGTANNSNNGNKDDTNSENNGNNNKPDKANNGNNNSNNGNNSDKGVVSLRNANVVDAERDGSEDDCEENFIMISGIRRGERVRKFCAEGSKKIPTASRGLKAKRPDYIGVKVSAGSGPGIKHFRIVVEC